MGNRHRRTPGRGGAPIKMGIGRAVQPDWLQGVSKAFSETVNAEARFMPRRLPGIIYIGGEELTRQVGNKRRLPDFEPRFREEIGKYIGSLIRGKVLDEQVLQPVTVPAVGFELRADAPKAPKLVVLVRDPSGNRLANESNLVRDQLFKAKNEEKDTHRIVLGVVTGQHEQVGREALDHLFDLVDADIQLSPVGEVHTGYGRRDQSGRK